MHTLARRHAGFSFIEVLIASVIFGIGLMGLAGLQTAALKTNTGAWQRSAASLLSHDLFERLRANPAAALAVDDADSYVSPAIGWSLGSLNELADLSNGKLCRDQRACTPEELRRHDLWFWVSQPHMLAQLPEGRAQVERFPVGAGFLYSITLTWAEEGASLASADAIQQVSHQALILPSAITHREITS